MSRLLISIVAALAVSVVQARKPNILFVLTDDQDIELGSMNYLSNVTSLLQDEGAYSASSVTMFIHAQYIRWRALDPCH